MKKIVQTFSGVSSRYIILYSAALAFLLTPFLMGGVVTGDEGALLSLVHNLDSSSLPFLEFARLPENDYIFHHLLWFGLLYSSVHVIGLFASSGLVTQAVVSMETVFAALMGMSLCYAFVVLRMRIGKSLGMATITSIFVASYGIFTICMGGFVECYMLLAVALRLFCLWPAISPGKAWKLAILDVVLFALKAYSLIFIIITLPLFWAASDRRSKRTYVITITIGLLIFCGAKLLVWNPLQAYGVIFQISATDMFVHLITQIFSPWTGILFCLPVLIVLPWTAPSLRRSLLYKCAGLLACMLFFSFFSFFDGDVPGGRYIFPFAISLVPELASALTHILTRRPRAIWLLPVATLAFLPVGGIGLPFYPPGVIPSGAPCTQLHPAVYAWKAMMEKRTENENFHLCLRGKKAVLDAKDAISVRIGLWRVGYLLSGGHSREYKQAVHNSGLQKEHDRWSVQLTDRLRADGMGAPSLWYIIGLIPAILALGMTMAISLRISRRITNGTDRTWTSLS